MIILILVATMVLILSEFNSDVFVEILLISVLAIWLMALVIAIYAHSQSFSCPNYDAMIVREIKSIIAEFNELYLKERGYIGKCDEWGIWVCVS